MRVLHADNVNEALYLGAQLFKEKTYYHEIAPRGMRTLESNEPVTTVYRNPRDRVLFCAERDANPFFHFFESLWMLSGRNDVDFLTMFNKRMAEFSDNGYTLNGAYGHRMRYHFGYDQLLVAIQMLQEDRASRRVVIGLWDPRHDLAAKSKDTPCNDLIMLKVRNGRLNMLVACRSNDMIWGAYGANAVHFSMIQEYIANKVGVDVGTYTQVSDSFHVYLDGANGDIWRRLDTGSLLKYDYYNTGDVEAYPMGADSEWWDHDLNEFMYSAVRKHEFNFKTEFFNKVVGPMYRAHQERDVQIAGTIAASDWRRACVEWLRRRREAKSKEQK